MITKHKNTQKPITGRSIRAVALTLLMLFCGFANASAAANIRVSGTVTADGETLIGATVSQHGSKNVVITNFDGKYEINVPSDASLTFSFVGFKPVTVKVDGRTSLNVEMEAIDNSLDEVVVVGYGVQKKKLVTGATTQVKGDDISKLNTTSALGALQSQAPGVNIVKNSGKPGEGFKVNIRGLGTIYNSSPLYIIDGVPNGDINLINPSDIESIDVLKDAASAAIYGARAANGVILVTTKQGKKDQVHVSFDMNMGWQSIPKTVKPLDAQDYVMLLKETGLTDDDLAHSVYTWDKIQQGWTGTNWLNEIKRDNAFQQSYTLGINGGGDRSDYSISLSYLSQQPTIGVKRNDVDQNYERFTARINSSHTIYRHNDLNMLKFGETLTMAYVNSKGMNQGTGNMYWNDVRNALTASPLFPLYEFENPEKFGWPVLLDTDETNPVAEMYYLRSFAQSKNYNVRGNFYLMLEPIKSFVFKTSFGFGFNGWNSREYVPEYQINEKNYSHTDRVTQGAGNGLQWNWDNTVSYNWQPGKNNFTFLLGNSLERWGLGADINGTNRGSEFDSFDYAYLSNVKGVSSERTSLSGAPWGQGSLVSFFGRVSYDYDNRYMATAVMRADGSSNFARGHRWGFFPSFSVGWNVAEEHFMDDLRPLIDQLKIRASWGENGNQNIPTFRYLSTIAFGNAINAAWYYFGNDKSQPAIGAYPDLIANPDLKWETSRQLDLGIDYRMLNSRLALVFDWYRKETLDWLVQPTVLGTWGTGAPFINGGDVLNTGVELALSWNDCIGGEFNYGASFNVAHNKNKVLRIDNGNGLIEGSSGILAQNTASFYRAEVGMPLGYFYGYSTNGIFQNQEQIDNYISPETGLPIMPSAKPGDVIFIDRDGDGSITPKDRAMIGNPYPDVTYGINLSASYKGIDLNISGYGVAGNEIARCYRSGTDKPYDNYTVEMLDRWHGEDTSNRLPSMNGSAINWQYVSDLYIEDGDYFRITNITLGYDFKSQFKKIPFSKMRLYFAVQNPFTFTKYKGMDPEIGYGGGESWAQGIDLGYYPGSRTFMIGANIVF